MIMTCRFPSIMYQKCASRIFKMADPARRTNAGTSEDAISSPAEPSRTSGGAAVFNVWTYASAPPRAYCAGGAKTAFGLPANPDPMTASMCSDQAHNDSSSCTSMYCMVIYDGLQEPAQRRCVAIYEEHTGLQAIADTRSSTLQPEPLTFVRCWSAVLGPQRGPRHGRDPCRRACSATWPRAAARARGRQP